MPALKVGIAGFGAIGQAVAPYLETHRIDLAGIGADRTTLEIWADPGVTRNVRRVEVDSNAASFSMEIQNLGQRLNLKIVAEGVETPAQQRFLTDLGCDSPQGFSLGKPLPARDFPRADFARRAE